VSDAKWTLNHGNEFPFHGKPATDWAERAALGVLADLTDRSGVKHELRNCDDDVRAEIVESLAAIIREAKP
jgi:hypothetical protein